MDERFEELATRDGMIADVPFVEMDDAFREGVYGMAAEAARVGKSYGLPRRATVPDGVENTSSRVRSAKFRAWRRRRSPASTARWSSCRSSRRRPDRLSRIN